MLESDSCEGLTRAVVAALADKDLEGLLAPMSNIVHRWYLASLPGPRGASAEVLAGALAQLQLARPQRLYADVVAAYQAALSASGAGDRVVVFGSFYTVGDLLRLESESCN
jgi:dihydrofolate synthase/folylpolyglutamate synthase